MKKRALIVGINKYHDAPLRGCVNDALMVSEMLTTQFGFKATEKRMLTDESATTKNIRERLHWLVDGAKPGDILYFHYSGHGSQMVDTDYDVQKEPDQLDEIICPVDLDWRENVIKDDELKRIFDKVPAGVNLTVVMDCCHSGSGMDHMNQWQPPTAREAYNYKLTEDRDELARSRALPMPADILNRGLGLDIGVPARSLQSRNVNAVGLLVTGCRSDQTSADAFIDGMYCGAATYALIRTLEQADYDISYKELVSKMNDFMTERGYTQRPELNGYEGFFGDRFFTEPDEAAVADAVAASKPSTGEMIGNIMHKIRQVNPKALMLGALGVIGLITWFIIF